MLTNDPLSRILYVDLARRRTWSEERPDLFEQGLGGTGVGIKLLEEEYPQGTDPLGPNNPIILTVGPLVGLFPLASKTVAMFKSPHTGNLGESHAGGRNAIAIRMAGYGAMVIRGASTTPVYLVVDGDQVHLRDALHCGVCAAATPSARCCATARAVLHHLACAPSSGLGARVSAR